MRELTPAEKSSLYDQGRCPFCGSGVFHEGPHGGLSVNFRCAGHCEAVFNLTPAAMFIGQLVTPPRTIGKPLPAAYRSPADQRAPEKRRWRFHWRRTA